MLEQEDISLKEACQKLEERYQSMQFTWASYGAYDKTMLIEQCTRFGIKYPMSNQHINVKVLFSDVHRLDRGIGMDRALCMLNLPLKAPTTAVSTMQKHRENPLHADRRLVACTNTIIPVVCLLLFNELQSICRLIAKRS